MSSIDCVAAAIIGGATAAVLLVGVAIGGAAFVLHKR